MEKTKKLDGILTFCTICNKKSGWSLNCPHCGKRKDQANNNNNDSIDDMES